MTLRIALLGFLFMTSSSILEAQMWNGQDTLYGHEWIDFDQSYIKLKVTTDGFCTVSIANLQQFGFPANGVEGGDLALYYLGEEIPIYVNNTGPLSSSDFLVFYGERNRSVLDEFLFVSPNQEMLNPKFSMFTDTSTYFLSWENNAAPLRFQEITNDISNPPIPEAWHWRRQEWVYGNSAMQKRYDSQNLVTFSHFDQAEGFMSSLSASHTISLNAPSIYSGDISGQLETRVLSYAGAHDLEVRLDGALIYSANPGEYEIIDINTNLDNSTLQNNMELTVEGLLGSTDRYGLAYIQLDYRSTFDAVDAARYSINLDSSSQERFIELFNFDTVGSQVLVFDRTHSNWLSAFIDDGVIKFVVPPSASSVSLEVLNTNTGYLGPDIVQTHTFENLLASDASYLILSHPELDNNGMGQDPVQAYSSYRSSTPGGGFQTQVIDVLELYDQFGYGIPKHPLALRNFFNYVHKNWTQPRYVLLIGHGMDYTKIRDEVNGDFSTHFVPTFGSPGSDNLLLSSNSSDAPLITVGRIAASDPSEISVYLDKVIEHEQGLLSERTVENHAWRKRVMHLSGGKSNELDLFEQYMGTLANIIATNGFGAEVTTYKKTSSSPVQVSVSDAIIEDVNRGIGIKTFLGHGAVHSVEFGMDNPTLFDNKGRYMLAFSLGCLSGNLFDQQNSVSERFTFEPDRGSIAYIASAGFAYPNVLRDFTAVFYELIGEEMYGESVGDILKRVREEFNGSPSFPIRTLVQQLGLHGDPAIRINGPVAPDYTFDPASVRFEPSVINAQADSFLVQFDAVNLGYQQGDTLALTISRQLPDGSLWMLKDTVFIDEFYTTFSYTLPVLGNMSRGKNILFLTIDADNEIPEGPSPLAELNNELKRPNGILGMEFFIIDNNAFPVYPANFSIVGSSSLKLIASTTDATAPFQQYFIQIDTTAYFNSPLFRSTTLVQEGGIIEWDIPYVLQDSMVYYWRVSVDTAVTATPDFQWNTSSFIYLPGVGQGWNQSHFFQFVEDELHNMKLEEPDRDFQFVETQYAILGEAMAFTADNQNRSRYFINNVRQDVTPNTGNRNLTIVVLDPQTGAPRINPANDKKAFHFQLNDEAKRKVIMDFLLDSVPDGHYVMLYTYHREGYTLESSTWAADSVNLGINLFQLLQAEGAVLVNQLRMLDTVPYIFAYQKGVEPIGEKIGMNQTDIVSLLFSFPVFWDEGLVKSTVIGPAQAWQTVEWDFEPSSNMSEDEWKLSVYVLPDKTAPPQLFMEYQEPGLFDISAVNSSVFPYIQLVFEARDTFERSSPNLEQWRVYFQPFGDLALAPNSCSEFYRDTLFQGEELRATLCMKNTSDVDMDSVLMKYTIIAANNNSIVDSIRYRPLQHLDTLHTAFAYDTRSLAGSYQLIIEANPDMDQPEGELFNNLAIWPFYVIADEKNPWLDVTFDGLHILDGDLISSRPEIVISLRDENPYLPIADTNSFSITLVDPDNVETDIALSRPDVVFSPAGPSDNENKAVVEFRPELIQDGRYKLRVNGTDAKGNLAGGLDFEVSFKVVNKRMISRLLPYPNPFSTACRFVYTLTGDSSPEVFKIQIMTVSGKIVKEITQAEFGPLRVGSHVSDYVWDGTDEYGNRLANGVYLYRVFTSNNQFEIEHYETKADQFFKKEFGKLVIMR